MPLFHTFSEIHPGVRRASAPTTTARSLTSTVDLVSPDAKSCGSMFEGYSWRCDVSGPNRRSSAPEHPSLPPHSVPPIVIASTPATPSNNSSSTETPALPATPSSPSTSATASPNPPTISELLHIMMITANVWFVVTIVYAVPLLLDLTFRLLPPPADDDSTLDPEDPEHENDDDLDSVMADTDNVSPSITPAPSPTTPNSHSQSE